MEASSTAVKQATAYAVLEVREAENPSEAAERQANIYYVPVATVTARAARDAVAKYVRENGIQNGGKYVAVPTRSFQVVTVATETQTRLKFS